MTFEEMIKHSGQDLEDVLYQLAEENTYWASCQKFYDSSGDTDLASMTSRQEAWAMKIVADLVKWREENG